MKKIYSIILLIALAICGTVKADEVTIGDESATNAYVPFYGYYCDQSGMRSQMIYPASELTSVQGKYITGITFYSTSASWTNTATFKVSLAEVDAESLDALNTTADFTEVKGAGTLPVDANYKMVITFDEPFPYSQGKNILVDVTMVAKGKELSKNYYGISATSGSSIIKYGSYSSATKQAFLPKATFTYEAPASGPALKVADGTTTLASGDNFSFGLATAGAEKTFTLSNPGTESITLNITATGGFGVSPANTTIAAKGEQTLTVTMADATGEGVVTITPVESVDPFSLNVSGTVRDASKLYETLLGGSIPEDWTTSGGTWSWSTANGASNTAWYETSNYRLITPQLIVAEGEKFFFEAQGTYSGYQGVKFEYSADGSTWTASATETAVTSDWQTFEINDVPAGKYYIALHGWHVNIRNFYGGTLPAKVKDVAAAGVTDTEATISWTAHGSETAWQVSYSTTSGDPNNGTIVDANSTSKALTGLNSSTQYYVSVRIGNSGEWSNEISFRTACGAITIDEEHPWTEDFSTYDVGDESSDAPACWALLNANSGSRPYIYISAGTSSISLSSKALYFSNYATTYGYAIFPTFATNLSGLQIAFSHIAESASNSGSIELGYMTNIADAETFTMLKAYAPSTTMKEEDAFALKAVPSGARLAIRYKSVSSYYDVAVDNITISVAPACTKPTGLTYSEVTSNSAKIAWTSEAAAWKLQISTDGENWNDVAGEITNPYTLNSLNDNTKYYVRVCANCGEDGDSEWTAAINFTTECAVKSLPFETEGFDAIPACWSVASAWGIYTYDGHSNSTSIRVKSSTADLTMPAITLSEKAQLSFYLSGSNSVKCYVYVKDGESEEKVGEVSSSTSWKQATVDLSDYIGKTVNIIFRSSSSSYYLYLDDVAVNYLPVAAPTNVAATPADESATVTWECEEATTYAVQYRVSGSEDTWTEVKDLTEKTYTIEGLTNGTAYEVQVKAIVSENRKSEWTASTVVTPAKCPTVTGIELSEKTFNSVKVSWTTSGVGTYMLQYGISPDVTVVQDLTETEYVLTNLTPGKTYTIRVLPECSAGEGGQETSYYPAYTAPSNVEVKNISDVTATASWDAVADATLGYTYNVVPRGQETGIWEGAKTTTETSVELSGLAGGSDYDFYVVTNYPGDNMSSAIKIEFSTVTVAPKSISVSEITASSAKLSWENDGAATAYEYALGDDPTALEWTEVAEKTKTLSELTANTSYTFYVRAKYSDKVKSDSVHITFRTDCNAIAELPWFEGFEDMAVGNYQSAAPACWAQLHVNDGLPYAYVNNTSTYVKTGSKSMYVIASSLTDGYLILPAFEVALNGLQISFSHKEESATKSTVLTLGYITDIANAETFVAVKEFGRATSWQEEKEISLAGIPNEVAATARLAFKLGKATDQWYTGIDDITIEEIPDCQKPVLGETTILPDGASFTWTAGGDETKFQYAVDTTETLVWTATETTEATVHGLVPGKDYKFYVRAFCDPQVSDSVWTVFAPVCNAPTEAALTAATTTTASFSWTAAANISSYQYVVMAKGVAADWSKAKTTSNTTAEWTELAANTVYDFYVRSYYNETVQSAAASLSFRTACAAIAALPWSENFEDQTLNAAPACWEVVDPNNTNIYVSTGSTWFNLGTTGLFFEGANANYCYILLPEFEVALNTLQISFSHSEEHSSNSGKIELGYYKDDEFTSLKAYDQSQKAWKAEGPFALTDVPAGARLAFGYKTNSSTYAAAIDNITIEEIPACAVPTDLAASEVTAATATLSWTSEAANFKVQYTTDKADWGEEIAVAAKTLALNDLTEQTTYFARVKAICGSEGESEYSEEISFTTPCAVKAMPYAESFEDGVPACWETTGTWTTNDESEFAHSGNALRASVKNKAATLTMPAIAITEEDAELVFYVRNVYGGSSYVSGEVIITPTVGEAKHVDVINSADINNKQKVDLSEFNGKNVVISFSISSVSSTAYVSIDEVSVAKKQCAAPTDVKVTEGDSKADVEWTAGEEETEWQVRYKASAAEDWKEVEGTIATTSYSITGLTNGTQYEVQVRAYCDETHQSAWTEVVQFTPSEATGMEYINGGEKAIKVMKNGVLYIIRDGVLYNAQGARVMDN